MTQREEKEDDSNPIPSFVAEQILEIKVSDLKTWKTNAKKHPKTQRKLLIKSIQDYGFTSPLMIDEANNLLAGHGRLEAAIELGFQSLPCIRLGHLTERQKRSLVIADNKIAERGHWDFDVLSEELSQIVLLEPDFHLDDTGFSIPEIDSIFSEVYPEEPNNPKDDELPEILGSKSRCKSGDIWELGAHRLVCGDCLDAGIVGLLTNGDKAQMSFVDPPYNVPIDGNVGGKGKIKHREFAMASGEMSTEGFAKFLESAFMNIAAHCEPGAICFACMDWRHQQEIVAAGDQAFDSLKNLIVWVKGNGGMGTFYRSRHELIYAFKVSEGQHRNNFELGQHGRHRTNVWNYAGVNSFRKGRMEELAMHPTVKPVELIADAIRDVSSRGGIVLDLFAGSGSTLIAAEKTGRRAYLCEIDPIYCDLIIKRWEDFTGEEANKIVPSAVEAIL